MSTKGTKIPAIKNIPAKTDPELKATLDSMKEAQEVRLGRRGDPRDRAVTLRELIDSGLANELSGSPFDPNGVPGVGIKPPKKDPPDLTVPPAPTGLEASGAFTTIVVSWNQASYGNHAYTEVWRSRNNEIGGAKLLTTSRASIISDPVDYNETFYYWVRFVSTSDITGPFNSTNGVEASTAIDIEAIMVLLSEELKNLPGFQTLLSDITVSLGSTSRTLQATLEAINTAVNTATANVNTLTSSTSRVIRADDPPSTRADSTDLRVGDIWIDSNDGNQIYVWTGTWSATVAGSTSSSDTTLQTQIDANGVLITQNASNLLLVAGVTGATNISTSVNITTLNAAITDSTTGLAATAGAVNALTTRVTNTETATTVNASNVTALQGLLNGFSGTNAMSTAISGLQVDIDANETALGVEITARALAITQLTSIVAQKAKTFIQDNAPTAIAVGDLWIDSNDKNKLYRAASIGADEVASGEWVAVNDKSGIAVFAQDDEPTGLNVGDLWFDTNDDKKQYRFDGTNWQPVDDARISSQATAISNLSTAVGLSGSEATKITLLEAALNGHTGSNAVATALNTLTAGVATNGTAITSLTSSITSLSGSVSVKTQTFVSNTAPVAISAGDLWIESDNNNKLYRSTAAGNSSWAAVNDTSGITVFTQASEPTGLNAGDLWFDTDDDNKQHVFDGTNWAGYEDTRVAANANAVTNLTTAVGLSGATSTKITALEATVNHGTTGVAATAGAVTQLEATVTAIPVNFRQANEPANNVSTLGDLWIDSDDNQLYRYNGSAWESSRDATLIAATSAISFLTASVGGNTSNIASNATAIADETAARASAVQQVNASIGTKNQTFISPNEPTAITAGDLWIDSDDNNLMYRATAPGSSNWVTLNDGKPRIFTSNDAPTAENTNDLWFETDNSNKQYRWDGSEWVEVRDVTTSASVTSLSQAVTDIEGNAAASYVLQVNANGAVAGMVIEANATDSGATTTAVQFVADKFAIWDGEGAAASNSIAPFIVTAATVINGENVPAGVYMTNAFIKNGSIDNVKLGEVSADKITFGRLEGNLIKANTINVDRINGGVIQSTDLSNNSTTEIHGGNIITGTVNATAIIAGTVTGTQINADTLNVKHFDNVSADIKSHRADGAFVPLSVEANVQSWSGTYPGQVIVSQKSSSVVNISCTTAGVRNNAKYRVVVSGVYGNVRNGTIQYSFDNSNFVSLSPTMNAQTGTYRTYVFVWDGQITGLSSSQSTVYWRINWNVSGGQVNSTYQALYVTIDNTQ